MRKLPDIDRIRETLRRIAAWRQDPEVAVLCPLCAAPGLAIVDCSSRPHAEWYIVACPTCGLDDTIHVPLPSPPLG